MHCYICDALLTPEEVKSNSPLEKATCFTCLDEIYKAAYVGAFRLGEDSTDLELGLDALAESEIFASSLDIDRDLGYY